MFERKPILVTGSHRSGSTWIGRMLATAPGIYYIHEPFSISDPPGRGICNANFKFWFTYITRENEEGYLRPLKNMIELRYDLLAALKSIRGRSDLLNVANEYWEMRKSRRQDHIPLIKDPFTFYSSEWLAERFEMAVVVIIRHPAAFVSSIKKLKWSHPFFHFLAQPLLIERVLTPFEAEIRKYTNQEQDLIDQGILLWKLIHWPIMRYEREHKEWIFIRHEDISCEPLAAYKSLFRTLGLEFTEHAQCVIEEYSNPENPIETDAPIGSENNLKLHSQLSVKNWKNRLTTAEIERIKRSVGDLSSAFYAENEW